MNKDQATIRHFACACGDKNKAEIQEVRDFVLNKLKMSDEWRTKYMADYQIDLLIKDMLVRWGAEVTGIPTDPGGWSAVTFKTTRTTPPAILWMECDWVVDGFYYGWKALYDTYGERLPDEDDE